ncbi:deoxyguanosinetriphosphate triphosphohydrolase, partial [bacterium]|nr:deoxyguanosinetriphosphate triphosphohydrolase [bacterium]
SELEQFLFVANTLGLPKVAEGCYLRHPLAFLVEAADDICYHFIDFGDGFRLGHVTYKEVEELFLEVFEGEQDAVLERIKTFHEDKDRIEYLAGKAISTLIRQVSEVFLDLEEDLIEGRFNEELIKYVPCAQVLDQIKKVSVKKVYGASEVLEIEAAGFEVLGGLLNLLIPAVEDAFSSRGGSSRSRKLLELVPNQFLSHDGTPSCDPYERVLKITDFVSGMTDSYAITFHGKISGRLLSGGRGIR